MLETLLSKPLDELTDIIQGTFLYQSFGTGATPVNSGQAMGRGPRARSRDFVSYSGSATIAGLGFSQQLLAGVLPTVAQTQKIPFFYGYVRLSLRSGATAFAAGDPYNVYLSCGSTVSPEMAGGTYSLTERVIRNVPAAAALANTVLFNHMYPAPILFQHCIFETTATAITGTLDLSFTGIRINWI